MVVRNTRGEQALGFGSLDICEKPLWTTAMRPRLQNPNNKGCTNSQRGLNESRKMVKRVMVETTGYHGGL